MWTVLKIGWKGTDFHLHRKHKSLNISCILMFFNQTNKNNKSSIHHISVYIVAIGCLKTLHLPKYQWRNYLYFMHQVVWHFAEWQGEILWCTHTGETGEEYKSQTTKIFTTRKIEALMEKKILMADAHVGNAGRYSSFTLYNKYYFHLLSFLLSGAKVACLYYIYLTKRCFVC